MKKVIISIIVLLAGVAAFLLLGGINSVDRPDIKEEEENKKIYIGVYEPVTGLNALGGNQELLGLQYAQSVKPTVSIGGEPYDIEFIIADNATESGTAERAANRLVNSEVSAVIGSYGSSVSIVGGEIFCQAGLPVVGASCTNPAVTETGESYFRVCFTDDFQGRVLANFVYGQGLRTAAVCTMAGDAYSRGLCEYFTEAFQAQGGKTHEFSFNSAQKNFDSLIDSIKASGADVVFIPSPGSNGAVFIRQARHNGLQLPIVGGDTWDTETIVSEIEIRPGTVYFSSPFNPQSSENAAASSFAAKFSSWVGGAEDRLESNGGVSYAAPPSALAYDAYMVLANAIELADSTDPALITEQLRLTSHEGVTGFISFNERGDGGQKTAYIKTITASGEFEVLQTVDAVKE